MLIMLYRKSITLVVVRYTYYRAGVYSSREKTSTRKLVLIST